MPQTAAVLDDRGIWSITTDIEIILGADPKKLIFVDSYAQLRAVLEEKNPAPHEDLTHVIPIRGNAPLRVVSALFWRGNDHAVLKQLVVEHKKISIDTVNDNYAVYNAIYNALLGCCMSCGVLIYDPTREQKAKKRKEIERRRCAIYENNMYVRVREIARATNEMRNILYGTTAISMSTGDSHYLGRYGAIASFLAFLRIFSVVFGKNAHRRVRGVQDLYKSWKQRQAQTNKKFKIVDTKDQHTRLINAFCEWMNKEVTVRLRKAKPPDEFKRSWRNDF